MSDLHARIQKLLDPAIQQITDLLRSEARQEIAHQILGHAASIEVPTATAPSLPPATTAAVHKRAQSSSARLIPKHCIFPGCNNDSKGPRYTFTCAEHAGASKKDKAKYLAEWKTSHQR